MTSDTTASHTWRIGVDVGGTFTDLVLARDDGALTVVKVPSVPVDPAAGVLHGLACAADRLGLDLDSLLGACRLFVHGTTVATNILLEGKGARVGMAVTAGFRDVVEIRRGWRPDPWDHRTPFPPPLVSRHLRVPIRGRLDRHGAEAEPLALDDVDACGRTFVDARVEAIAVCLFNSFLDRGHEHAAAARLAAGGWADRPVYCSADVVPVMGEYERWATTVVNAYVGPRTVGYLEGLDRTLSEHGLTRPMLLIQNNGGAVTLGELTRKPATLLLSGPAAGVGALRLFARAIGSDDLISMEIGGTSCDVMIMHRGEVGASDHLEIGGYDLFLPSVDIHTIGAGGGTIAGVDAAGLLFAGPKGAGATPGPAAYRLGGREPTLTDALLVLGRLRPAPLGDGTIVLDRDAARAAVARRVAGPLGLSPEDAARGIVTLVEQKLLQAVQRVSSARGHDPADFTLVACGGAGPMHGAAIGRKLGCRRVYVPRQAGAFCALGMLNSDVRHDFLKVHLATLDAPGDIETAFATLEEEATRVLADEGFAPDARRLDRQADLRYAGQHWDVTVDASSDIEALRVAFEARHERLFGHHLPGTTIEITKLRITGNGLLPPLALPNVAASAPAAVPVPVARQTACIDDAGTMAEIPVYDGAGLAAGAVVEGPALIEERTTTVFAGPGDRVAVDSAGDFVITLGF